MDHRVAFRSLDKDLLRVSRWRGGLDVALVWLGVFAVAAIVGRSASVSFSGAVLSLAAVILIGIFQHGLAALGHHAVHTNLHPSKAVNDKLFRWLIAAPTGQSLLALRREHLLHHATFGTAKDPERYYYDLSLGRRDTAGRFVTWSVLMFAGYVVARQVHRVLSGSADGSQAADTPASGNDSRRELLCIIPAQAVLFALMYAATGSVLGYFFLWALPLLTVGGGLNGMRATLEHADPTPARNLNHAFISNPIERWALGPYNFSYHYEHHRFMTVPYYRVAALRRILQDADDYAECSLEKSYIRRYLQIVRDLRSNPQPGPIS